MKFAKKAESARIQQSPKPQNKEPEAQGALSRQPDPLAQVNRRVGDASSATAHASTLNRAKASSLTRARLTLVRLQRQYGNRFVQRVLALARKSKGEAEVAPEVEQSIERTRGGGQALDSQSRAQMGSAFHADFSGVRVHTDREADSLNQALNARAFTTGKDIFFRQGQYNPGSSSGQELLAHELTHVVQQTGNEIQPKLTLGQPGDRYEQEADQVARTVTQQEQGAAPQERDDGQAQRQIEEEEEEEEAIQMQAEEEEEEELVQTQTEDGWVQQQAEEREETPDAKETEDAGVEIEIKPGPVSPVSKPSSRSIPTTEQEETPEGQLQRKISKAPDIQRITPEAVGAAVAVIAVTYSVVKDIVDMLDGDVKYSFDRMRGQKYPKNNKNWAKITPWHSTYVDLSFWRKNGWGTKTGMKVRVHWEYNGYGLSGVYITKRWAGDAAMWGANFIWLIQPLMATRKDVNGHPVALVKVVLDATFTRTLASDISDNASWIIDGEGKVK